MRMITLEYGRTRAQITPEVGGRLHQIWVRKSDTWFPLLYAPAKPPQTLTERLSSSSYVMAPWPNRIDGGRFTFEGRVYNVPVNDGGHALHGRTVFQPWTVEQQTPASCRLSVAIDDGWPLADT